MEFDAAIWRAQRGTPALEQVNPRGDMVVDLKSEHLQPGTPREQVLALLGAPEFSEDETDHYALGRTPFGVSFEQLAIEYDDGALVRAYVQRT